MGKHNVVNICFDEQEEDTIKGVFVHNFRALLERDSAIGKVCVTEFRLSEDRVLPPHKVIGFVGKQIRDHLIAAGYCFHIKGEKKGQPPRSGLRLMVFHLDQKTGSVWRHTDNIYETDVSRFAQIPNHSHWADRGANKILFMPHSKHVLCVAGLHPVKQVMQIYYLYKDQFVSIGGTNCKTPGLFIMDPNQAWSYMNDTCYGGILIFGITSHLQVESKVVEVKTYEMKLCF